MNADKLNTLQESALVQRFEKRSKLYLIFNVLLVLWILTQIGLYGHQVAQASSFCTYATNLGIGYLVNYCLYFFVPLLVIACLRGKQIIPLTIAYCGLNILIKIIVLILLLTIAWRHVGSCYISSNLKATIIANSVVQLLSLIVQIWLLSRIRFISLIKKNLLNNTDGLTLNKSPSPMYPQ